MKEALADANTNADELADLELGHIFICPAEVHRRAELNSGKQRRMTLQLAVTINHAVLHLLGFRHDNDDEHRTMVSLERFLLRQQRRFHGLLRR